MQVSVYLHEHLIKQVDRLAKKEGRSRSKVIEALLESALKKGKATRLDSLAGVWKDDRSAEAILAEIYKDRDKNQRSGRVAL